MVDIFPEDMKILDISTGGQQDSRFSCAVLENYTVSCWGMNSVTTLGDGLTDASGTCYRFDSTPVLIDRTNSLQSWGISALHRPVRLP